MNRILIIALMCTIYSINIFTMEQPLTSKETACFNWFDKHTTLKATAYKSLSKEESDIMSKGVRYTERPDEVTNAVQQYAKNFCDAIQKENINPEYDSQLLSATLLKMKIAMQNNIVEKPTDYTSARMYVYSKLLTPEEQNAYKQEGYLKGPEYAHTVVNKFGGLLADELVKIGIIKDTEEEKAKAAQEYITKKTEELKTFYNK